MIAKRAHPENISIHRIHKLMDVKEDGKRWRNEAECVKERYR
jgi:hypothetical protein